MGQACDQSGPLFVVAVWQIDWNDPTNTVRAMADAGFNVIILAFYLSSGGAVDAVQAWAGLSDAARAASVAYAHSVGAIVMLSAGGATGP